MGIVALQGKFLIAVACAGVFAAFIWLLVFYRGLGVSYLKLTKEGFEFASLLVRQFVAWKDVREFVPYDIGIGWNYETAAPGVPRIQRLSGTLTGIEAALPDTYGHSPGELVTLMNGLRQKYSAR